MIFRPSQNLYAYVPQELRETDIFNQDRIEQDVQTSPTTSPQTDGFSQFLILGVVILLGSVSVYSLTSAIGLIGQAVTLTVTESKLLTK